MATFTGTLEEVGPARAVVTFGGRMPPTFALGESVELELESRLLPEPVRTDATIVRRLERSDARQYVLDYHAPQVPLTPIPQRRVDRRSHLRITAPAGAPAPIRLVPIARSGRARTNLARDGRLLDVGGGGLGVLLDDTREGPLTGHERVRVHFRAPGTDVSIERDCRIRSRWMTERGIRLGLQLEVVEDETLAFEPLWTCTHCTEKSMLEKTHPHCCACGKVRSAAAELVDWGDLVPRGEHRFTGLDQECTACGAAWAALARHCGTCGTALRRGQR